MVSSPCVCSISTGLFARQEHHPWSQPRINAIADDGGQRYGSFWDWVDTRTPAGLWQLDSIAVEPTRQGRGVGRALIEAGLARAGATGAFLSTGTPANVEVYSRCGFHVLDARQAPGNGPRIWFMRSDRLSSRRSTR